MKALNTTRRKGKTVINALKEAIADESMASVSNEPIIGRVADVGKKDVNSEISPITPESSK